MMGLSGSIHGRSFRAESRDGNPVISPTFEDTMGLYPEWKGSLYTATAEALSFFDEVVTTEKQLRGGWYELFDDNAVEGDYLEFSVVDKNNVLGLFGALGLTVGEDVLELAKYVKTEYINPARKDRQIFMANSTFVVYPGLYIRTIYNSEGTNDVTFKVVTHVFQ
jgi:hypothetical protein